MPEPRRGPEYEQFATDRKRWLVGGGVVGALMPGLPSGIQIAAGGQGLIAVPYMMGAGAIVGAFVGVVLFTIRDEWRKL